MDVKFSFWRKLKLDIKELLFRDVFVPHSRYRYIDSIIEMDIDKKEIQLPTKDYYYLVTFSCVPEKIDENLKTVKENLEKIID